MSALQNLRCVLADIKAVPGTDFLHSEREMVILDDSVWIDTRIFEAQAERLHGEAAAGNGLPDGSAARMEAEQVIQLYGAGFLAGFRINDSQEFDDWQYFHAQHYQQAAVSMLATLARYYTEIDSTERARSAIRCWLALDPLAEGAHRLSMRLYAHNGETDQALHLYQSLVRVLQYQEGVEPEPETRALYEQIRSGKLAPCHSLNPTSPLVSSILPGQPARVIGHGSSKSALVATGHGRSSGRRSSGR